jgi:hypothetical protein
VKHTQLAILSPKSVIKDTIQNGVKYTSWHEPILLGTKVEDAIQNGVKETKNRLNRDRRIVEDAIINGVKENNTVNIPELINNVIENKLNEKILKAAVEQFVMGLVFDLLSGCNSKLISAIIQPNVATAITPLVEHAQKVKSGEIAEGTASAINTTVDATIATA